MRSFRTLLVVLTAILAFTLPAQASVSFPDFSPAQGDAVGEDDSIADSADEALGFVANWMEKGAGWIENKSVPLLIKFIGFLLILFVFKIIGGFITKLVMKAMAASKLNVSALMQDFVVNIIGKVVLIAAWLIGLKHLGADLGPILAGIGVLGFVVGFALQETLSNFAAGVMILLYQPFDIGHVIQAAGITGKVSALSLVSTTIMTPDNQTHVVPNGAIWGGVITNVTSMPTRRVNLEVGIGYDDDIAKAEKVLAEIVTAHPQVLKDPEPVIKLNALGASSVDFVVRPWCNSGDYWDVYWDLTREIKLRFDKEGISFPYPQRDVHLIGGNNPA